MFETRLRSAFVAVAFFGTFAAAPCWGSFVRVDLTNGQWTDVPGQTISGYTATGGFEKGQANYGVLRNFASSPNVPSIFTEAGVASQFQVDFTLSSAATLRIGYHYHFLLSETAPGSESYKFGISTTSPSQPFADPGNSSWNLLVWGVTNPGSAMFNPDTCYNSVTGFYGSKPAGACGGDVADSGYIDVPFNAGHNWIHPQMWVNAYNGGTADAWNTGEITSIVVPNGVTFTYDDLSGNPLNAGPASATPEPATWAFAGIGLAMLSARAIGRTRG